MERKERLQAAYDYLRSQGKVHTQKDLAIKLGASASNVSAAFSGVKEKLTDNFLKRFNTAFGKPFNLEWLINGDGEMLTHPTHQEINGSHNTQVAGNANNVNSSSTIEKAIDEISAHRKLLSKSQEQIDRLLSIIENMTRGLGGE